MNKRPGLAHFFKKNLLSITYLDRDQTWVWQNSKMPFQKFVYSAEREREISGKQKSFKTSSYSYFIILLVNTSDAESILTGCCHLK